MFLNVRQSSVGSTGLAKGRMPSIALTQVCPMRSPGLVAFSAMPHGSPSWWTTRRGCCAVRRCYSWLVMGCNAFSPSMWVAWMAWPSMSRDGDGIYLTLNLGKLLKHTETIWWTLIIIIIENQLSSSMLNSSSDFYLFAIHNSWTGTRTKFNSGLWPHLSVESGFPLDRSACFYTNLIDYYFALGSLFLTWIKTYAPSVAITWKWRMNSMRTYHQKCWIPDVSSCTFFIGRSFNSRTHRVRDIDVECRCFWPEYHW